MSRVFRGKFLSFLRKAFRKEQLAFHGDLSPLAQLAGFDELVQRAFESEWVVYAKPPFGGPDRVLRYLARYSHRVAISNQRLISIEGDEVTFGWKDYAHDNKNRTMTLKATEFLRRFIMHVLPKGFVRIRSFGFLANRRRAKLLHTCRELLKPEVAGSEPAISVTGAADRIEQLHECPVCHDGILLTVELLPQTSGDSPNDGVRYFMMRQIRVMEGSVERPVLLDLAYVCLSDAESPLWLSSMAPHRCFSSRCCMANTVGRALESPNQRHRRPIGRQNRIQIP
jgi:hypothetical protein